jgi:hypothetical protein
MEDFLFHDAVAGQAAELIEVHPSTDAVRGRTASHVWQRSAEDCVLARLKSIRIYGGLARGKRPLSRPERISRLQDLLRLWANGCTCAIDEELFADLLDSRPDPQT